MQFLQRFKEITNFPALTLISSVAHDEQSFASQTILIDSIVLQSLCTEEDSFSR